MTGRSIRLGIALCALGLAGCATRADLLQQDRRMRAMIGEQKKMLDQVRREVERLRADIEEGGGRVAGGGRDRVTQLEQRMATLEGGASARNLTSTETAPEPPAPPTGESTEAAAPTPAPPVETASKPPTPVPPPPPAEDADEWQRDVSQEQAVAATVDAPEKKEYLAALDGLAKKDCNKAVPQLNGLAATQKGSPLADNALYWAARCYQARGDNNQAISKYYDVVTRYPKSDKAASALWLQGNLFLRMNDTPDARLALSKLIRDYPNSSEAGKARQKLSELEQ